MIMLIDTREQNPLEFSHEIITGTENIKLPVGDYGVRYKQGYIPPIIFERKSISDLFGTLSGGYERFKREIERAKELDFTLFLIIEGSLSRVLKGSEPSTIPGKQIIKQLMTLYIRYNITPIFCKNREEMAYYITELYLAIGRNLDFKKMGYNK